MADSILLTPAQRYRLRIADTCLVHAQRLAEWCGHAPVLEEDIALSNMALDLLGQARGLLSHVAQQAGAGFDEDRLAFLRDERDYLNLTLVEQPLRRSSGNAPGGDFADTVLRNFLLSTWLKLMWSRLLGSSDETLAAIAGKALKEARYHQQHAADWAVRLGDGSEESALRMQAALRRIWPYTREMFADDVVDTAAAARGLGPLRSKLHAAWLDEVNTVLMQAQLAAPADTPFISTGTQGRHSEHLGYLLAEMQALQRQHPGGRW
ncbi:MAG: phenylacetate-CoA oxygenase subunit PaaC [Rubrivivax sp.]|nr:phenylacetate-CoA oxygenase subunit PaaC [Rubrivivax sp.]